MGLRRYVCQMSGFDRCLRCSLRIYDDLWSKDYSVIIKVEDELIHDVLVCHHDVIWHALAHDMINTIEMIYFQDLSGTCGTLHLNLTSFPGPPSTHG